MHSYDVHICTPDVLCNQLMYPLRSSYLNLRNFWIVIIITFNCRTFTCHNFTLDFCNSINGHNFIQSTLYTELQKNISVTRKFNYKSSVIWQKGESQNGGNKNTKHAKFSKERTFFGKFGVLCILVTSVLRFALLPYYRRNCTFY